MTTMASQITSLMVVYSIVYSGADQRKPKLHITGLCAGNSPGPVNSPHIGPVTRKMLPFDDVTMRCTEFTGIKTSILLGQHYIRSICLRKIEHDLRNNAQREKPCADNLIHILNKRHKETPQIAKFMEITWGPPGSCRPQMGPMLAPWTLLSGVFFIETPTWPRFDRHTLVLDRLQSLITYVTDIDPITLAASLHAHWKHRVSWVSLVIFKVMLYQMKIELKTPEFAEIIGIVWRAYKWVSARKT